MKEQYILHPEGRCKPKADIADLIPFGRKNAISREMLLVKCKDAGIADDDRVMRKEIQKARLDYSILSRDDGGYYRPTKEDQEYLARYCKRERARAKSVFRSIRVSTKLLEDFKRGVL